MPTEPQPLPKPTGTTTGHICGLVLSGLASYCDNPSLNPAEVLSLNSVTKLFEKEAEIAEKDTELKM